MSSEKEAHYWDQFRTVVAKKLEIPIERVQRNSVFNVDLKADSLDIADLLMDLEDLFQIVISEKEAAKLETAGAFFDYVYARIGSNAA